MTRRPLWPPHDGHPFWCGDITEPLDCGGENHEYRVGAVVANEGLVTVILSQPDDTPVVTLVGEDGPLFSLPVDQVSLFASWVHFADSLSRGEWPDFELPA